MGQAQVVPDIELQRAGRNVAGIRLTVRLNLVGLPSYQLRGFLKVLDRKLKPSQRDVTMASMSIEPSISGKFVDAVGKDLKRFSEATEITQSPSQPDDCIRIV